LADLIVRGGSLIDGAGAPARDADLVVDDGKITLVGDAANVEAARTVDAHGKTVCPGFIDIHNHSDFPLYVDGLAQSGVRQGLTTLVTGNCGHGPAPAPDRELTKQVTIGVNDEWGIDFAWTTFEEYLGSLEAAGQSMNVAPLVAHGAVRMAAMGFDARPPTAAELADMRSMVAEAMSAGAIGFSTGLEYSPGRHADEAELIELSRVSARRGGIYASHIRERGDNFEAAVDEALNIARQAGLPAQLAHLAPRPYAPEGAFDRVLETIHNARDQEGLRIGIDTFPDPWGPAHLLDLVPPWVYEGSDDEVLARLEDPDTADQSRDYFENPTNFLLRLGGFDTFFLSTSNAHPELVGRSLQVISREWELDPVRTIMALAAADGKDYQSVLIRHIFATQDDLDKLLLDPYCSVESDGVVSSTAGILKSLVANRSSFGYAPRFIREYALDRGLFTVEEAVRKMTSLPADSAQLHRGRLEPGKAADFVVLDLDTIADNTTDDAPQAYPSGIEVVAVNGGIVVDNGAHTGATPGQLVRI
jgi:N-acyl-D-amino-acid deacylase